MERILKCVISVDGTVLVTKQNGFENESSAVKIVASAIGFENYNKFIDFNHNGSILKSQNLSNGTKDFVYLIPQNLTSGNLKFQFVLVKDESIVKTQIVSIDFKESINATEEISPSSYDIFNDFEVRIQVLEQTLDNTIQDIFDKDLAINNKVDNYIESNDAALAEEISGRIAADYRLYEDLTQGIKNAKQQVKDDIIGGAPSAFDTLVEIAAIFQNDPNLVATILNTLATKVDKIAGKGLSTNDLTNELKAAYDLAVTNNHTHGNKAVLDLITDLVKAGYDNAASKAHDHTDLATLNALTAIWKLAVDDVVSRLAAKWMGSDINLNQIGLTHLTAALQQLIGSNNNITNYPDAATIESYLDNSVNKLRIKDLGVNSATKIDWKWGGGFKGIYIKDNNKVIIKNSINNSFGNKNFSFSLKFYIDTLPTFSASYAQSLFSTGSTNYGYGFEYYNFGGTLKLAFVLRSTVRTTYYLINPVVGLNNIILSIYNQVKITCLYNNVRLPDGDITNQTGDISNTSDLAIGNQIISGSTNSYFSPVKIYVLKLFNLALSNQQQIDEYNNSFDSVTNYKFRGASNTIINSGLLTIGKNYKIITYTSSDFTTVGALNNNIGTEFIATGVGTGLLDVNNTVMQIGCVLEMLGENAGHNTWIDVSGNNQHGNIGTAIIPLDKPLIQKAWTGNFTTNIASGTANKDVTIPAGYLIEMITLTNTTADNITNFKAILNPSSWNQTLFSGKTIAASATLEISQLADRYVDNVNNMTLRFNCTGNGTGGIDIMVLLRRND